MITLAIAGSLLLAAPTSKLDPAAQTFLNIRVSAAVLENYFEREPLSEEAQPSISTLDAFAPKLTSEERRLFATRDGWNRSLRIVVGYPAPFALLSYGADGEPDLPYEDFLRGAHKIDAGAPLDPSSPDRDIIFTGSEFVQRPGEPKGRSERAADELRAIGTALELFAVDTNVYPATRGLQTIDAIVAYLEGLYVKTVPRLDPWGRPYLVWSDGSSYLVVAAGEDGIIAQPYEGGLLDGPIGDDLCFMGGTLYQGERE